jgi:hypothetical protein
MNATRRQFVTATVTGLPVLMSTAASAAQGQPGNAPADDPVLQQIGDELVRTYNELKDNPKRVDSLRAFESALRLHAAQATAARHNELIKASLARRIKEQGRDTFIDEVVSDTHGAHRRETEIKRRFPGFRLDPRYASAEPPVREQVDRVAGDLLRGGFTAALVGLADQVKAVNEKVAAAQVQVNARVVRRDESDCYYARMAAEYANALLGMVCALAVFQPEFVAVCAVMGMEVAIMQLVAMIACWI